MRRAAMFLAVAGLVFESCGPTGDPGPSVTFEVGSSAPASAPPSRLNPTAATPTQAPASHSSPDPGTRPATSLLDNLVDRIEAGDWTLEQGLIETLEYLNGEREVEAILPAGELVDFEATPILVAAQQYLAANPESAESARMRELFRQIVPTSEQLRLLSAGSGATATLAGERLVGGGPVDCSELWRLVPDPPSPGRPCLDLDEFTFAGGGTGRVYTPVDTLVGPDADRFVRLVTEALQDSWRVLETIGAGMPNDVDVVYDPRGLRTASAGATLAEWERCLVLVYPVWLVEPEGDARFILAHEAAHCFQLYQTDDGASQGPPWSTEGSANYIANVVYPDVNTEYFFLDWLRPYEPNHSLLRLSYDAFPFFQYMGNEFGDEQVVALIQHLARGSPADSFADMPAIFHGYAEDFLTDRIIDSSGEPIPIDAQAQNYGRFRPTAVGPIVEVQPKPFVIERLIIDWDEDREFDLDVRQVGNLLISAQPYHDGTWGSLPDPVRTCDAGLTHRVAVTRVEPAGDATVRLDLTQLEAVDTCLVQITVHGAIEAVFTGGVCYVDDNFLHVTAGFGLSDDDVEQIGPYPRGYGFILGTATPGSEEPGHPDVTIADNEHDFTEYGSNASLVKSADLLSGTFSSDDIFGDYSCPFLTPPDELP